MAYARPERRTRLLLSADLAVTAGLLLSTAALQYPSAMRHGVMPVTGIWVAGPGLSTGAVLAFAAAACVVLGAAGAAVRTTGDPAFRRLRSVLWLLSTVSLAAFTGTLAAGVLLRQAWLVALGAVGVLLVTPQITSRYLPTSAAAPLAILVVGVVLLGSAVWLARHRAGSRERRG